MKKNPLKKGCRVIDVRKERLGLFKNKKISPCEKCGHHKFFVKSYGLVCTKCHTIKKNG